MGHHFNPEQRFVMLTVIVTIDSKVWTAVCTSVASVALMAFTLKSIITCHDDKASLNY